ncbi:hypothetical protein PCANC_19224 [Puccinia coronata f. sp. avenae]|uniref:Uncharacterized protein n=1 Tax=Puccinia coronata f. sp. avenae TaxID=200324 RepID=A0A2N5SK26_9BASI|nr:hypothetical protein PCANC_19224 [Puccinia coronata f. sp. avenae]
MNVIKSFIVLTFDYFLLHVLVVTVGSTSADSPSRTVEKLRSGSLSSRSTDTLAKRGLPKVLDGCKSSVGVLPATLHPGARVDVSPTLDDPMLTELANLDGQLDGNQQAEERVDQEAIISNDPSSPIPGFILDNNEGSLLQSERRRNQLDSNSQDSEVRTGNLDNSAGDPELTQAENLRLRGIPRGLVRKMKATYEDLTKSTGTLVGAAHLVELLRSEPSTYTSQVTQLLIKMMNVMQSPQFKRIKNLFRPLKSSTPSAPLEGIELSTSASLDRFMADNKRRKGLATCIIEGSQSSRNLDRSVGKNMLSNPLKGNEKPTNTEEMIHNAQFSTYSPRLELIGTAFHHPENGEMIHPLMTDRTDTDFGHDNHIPPIPQENAPEHYSSAMKSPNQDAKEEASHQDGVIVTGNGTGGPEELPSTKENEILSNRVDVEKPHQISPPEKELKEIYTPDEGSPSQDVKGDASSQEAGVKETRGAGGPDNMAEKKAPEPPFKFNEIEIDQPPGTTKNELKEGDNIAWESSRNKARKDSNPQAFEGGDAKNTQPNRDTRENFGAGHLSSRRPALHDEQMINFANRPVDRMEEILAAKDQEAQDFQSRDNLQTGNNLLGMGKIDQSNPALTSSNSFPGVHHEFQNQPHIRDEAPGHTLKHTAPHESESDASLQAKDQMTPPPSQSVIEPPASHISKPPLDNLHATIKSETNAGKSLHPALENHEASTVGEDELKFIAPTSSGFVSIQSEPNLMRSADSQSQSANYEARSDFPPGPNASQFPQTNDYFYSAQQASKPSTSHQAVKESPLDTGRTGQGGPNNVMLSSYLRQNSEPRRPPSPNLDWGMMNKGPGRSMTFQGEKRGRTALSRLRTSGSQMAESKMSEYQDKRGKSVTSSSITPGLEESKHITQSNEYPTSLDHHGTVLSKAPQKANKESFAQGSTMLPSGKERARKNDLVVPSGLHKIKTRQSETSEDDAGSPKSTQDDLEAQRDEDLMDYKFAFQDDKGNIDNDHNWSTKSSKDARAAFKEDDPMNYRYAFQDDTGLNKSNKDSISALREEALMNSLYGSPLASPSSRLQGGILKNSPRKEFPITASSCRSPRRRIQFNAEKTFYLESSDPKEKNQVSQTSQLPPPVIDETLFNRRPIARTKSAYVGSPRIRAINAFADDLKLKKSISFKSLSLADLEECKSKPETVMRSPMPTRSLKPTPLELMVSKRFIETINKRRDTPTPTQRSPYYIRKAEIIGGKKLRRPIWKGAKPPKPRSSNSKKNKNLPAIKSHPFKSPDVRNFIARLQRFDWKKTVFLFFQQPLVKLHVLYLSLQPSLDHH